MQIKENILLAPFTTFKIGGKAKYFCEVKDQFDALTAFEFAKEKNVPVFILGGGSNVLISDSGFNGLVARVINSGIEIISESANSVVLKIASGENWDSVVAFAVKNNWWGIENLSHIPGSTGAIAVQNVGAYGQEAKNVIESVTVFDTKTHEITSMKNKECGFGYRSSIFNTSRKGRYIIFNIVLRLSKVSKPILEYRDLNRKFEKMDPKLFDIRNAVIAIRDTKFPFPIEAKKGNAGSFFKNSVLEEESFKELEKQIEIQFGNKTSTELEKRAFIDEKKFKVPTAFLLDVCGFKDLEFGGAAINHNQPLVIINKTGKATAADVLGLAKMVKKTVYEKLGLNIHIEPELIGFSSSELAELV